MQNKILIINFSLQKESQSQKVAQYLLGQVNKDLANQSKVLNYIDLDLPLWNEDLADNEQILKPIIDNFKEAAGYIFVIPEYNGACSPALGNLCLFLSEESNHKAVLLVSVSAGKSGSYPITQARAYSYKNTKLNYIPEHLIIRDVNSVLNTITNTVTNTVTEQNNNELSKEDKYIRDRITYTLSNFDVYCKYSKLIKNEVNYNDLYSYGM